MDECRESVCLYFIYNSSSTETAQDRLRLVVLARIYVRGYLICYGRARRVEVNEATSVFSVPFFELKLEVYSRLGYVGNRRGGRRPRRHPPHEVLVFHFFVVGSRDYMITGVNLVRGSPVAFVGSVSSAIPLWGPRSSTMRRRAERTLGFIWGTGHLKKMLGARSVQVKSKGGWG